MKILIIQEHGRHKQNWHMRECESFKRAFTKLGVQCDIWGMGYYCFRYPFKDFARDYDVLFLLENYDDKGWVPNLSSFTNKLRIQLVIDAHCNLDHLVNVCNKNAIDIHLGATRSYLKHFEKPGRKTVWFPNCYDPEFIYPMQTIKKQYHLGWVGNYVTAERKHWIKQLESQFGMHSKIFQKEDGSMNYDAIGEGMVRALNSYKIVFNRCISDDTNYRCFETLGTKSFLLTNKVPDLSELFIDGKHLVTYDSIEDFHQKMVYYLDHENEREAIATEGCRHVQANHTFLKRAEQFLELVKTAV